MDRRMYINNERHGRLIRHFAVYKRLVKVIARFLIFIRDLESITQGSRVLTPD
jgi:hypothetical protein